MLIMEFDSKHVKIILKYCLENCENLKIETLSQFNGKHEDFKKKKNVPQIFM